MCEMCKGDKFKDEPLWWLRIILGRTAAYSFAVLQNTKFIVYMNNREDNFFSVII